MRYCLCELFYHLSVKIFERKFCSQVALPPPSFAKATDGKPVLLSVDFFLLAKISGVQRSGRRMTGNLSSIALAEEEALATEGDRAKTS